MSDEESLDLTELEETPADEPAAPKTKIVDEEATFLVDELHQALPTLAEEGPAATGLVADGSRQGNRLYLQFPQGLLSRPR